MRFLKSIFFFLALTFCNLGTIELQGSYASTRILTRTPSFNNETFITGIWTGTLNAGGMQLKLEFHIKSIDNKTYRTYLSVPQQGAKDLPMDNTEVSKNKITIKSNILGAVFEGKWDQKNTITGTFEQNGQSFPLELTRGSVELIRPQTPKAPFRYNSKIVQFSNGQGTCRFQGTVTTPFDSIAKGTILLFSGSGAQNRDEEIFGHKPFAVLADTFTKAGYNVLRVDDRGAGYTVCKPSEPALPPKILLRWRVLPTICYSVYAALPLFYSVIVKVVPLLPLWLITILNPNYWFWSRFGLWCRYQYVPKP